MLSVAVVLHLYHAHQWPALRRYIRHVPAPFALFVTVPADSPAISRVRRDFPQADIRQTVNVGRDVAPFLALLPELQRFDLVCKIHTKGNDTLRQTWQLALLRGLLGSRRLVRAIITAFATDPELILAGPARLWIDGPRHLMGTGPEIRKRCEWLPANYGFFAGTMFWMRPGHFADFSARNPQSDFIPHNDFDYHPEHAIERLFGIRAAQLGLRICLTHDDCWGRHQLSTVASDVPVQDPGIDAILNDLARRQQISCLHRLLLRFKGIMKALLSK